MTNQNYKLTLQEKRKIRNTSDPIREELNKESLIIRFMEKEKIESNKKNINNTINKKEIKIGEEKEKKKNKSKKKKSQTGGVTYLPHRFYNANTKLSNPKTNMETAYGKANPVSGPFRNLAPFPNSSGIQTGGNLRKCPFKKAKEFSLGKKKRGSDGNMWIVSKRSDNIKYWKRV